MTIAGLYRKMEALNTEKVITDAFDETLPDLVNINRERMTDGVRADGSIMPFYSKTSQAVFGYPNTPIKLKATGAFQAAIEVKRSGNVLTTDSTDEKNGMLEGRYGKEIFGTGGSYKKQYIDENLGVAFRKNITTTTGLKFGR